MANSRLHYRSRSSVLACEVSPARAGGIEAIMTEHFFDYDRLDVYRLAIEYVATAFDTSRSLPGLSPMVDDAIW